MEHYFIAMVSSFSDFHASADGFTSEDESLQAFNAADSSFIKSSSNWLDELSNLPSDWALLPLNGIKIPFNPITNELMKGWSNHPGFSIDEIQELSPKAVGVMTGPVSGGLLAVDFDGPGSEEQFQHVFGRPSSELPASISWSSGKVERRQVAFTVDQDWWNLLKGKVFWKNTQDITILELRWKGQQSVIAGAHPETTGYSWLAGCSPVEFAKPAIAPDWLLMPLLLKAKQKHVIVSSKEDKSRAIAMLACIPASEFSNYDSWLKVGMALHSVDAELITDWIQWSSKMSNFDEDECDQKWNSFGNHETPVTIGTLCQIAVKYGYKAKNSNCASNLSNKLQIKKANSVCADVGKITWPLPQFAATGLVLLAADQGIGKTSLLYSAAEAIQEGNLFLDHIPATAGRVLILQGDESEEIARMKFRRMGLKANFDIVYVNSALDLVEVIDIIISEVYSTIIIDSLTTVLLSAKCTTVDHLLVEKLYTLNREASNHGVLVLMTAHLNKTGKDGSGNRLERRHISWADISGLNTIGAAVNDCWGLTNRAEGDYSLHCLGKRYVEKGTEWIIEGDPEDFSWRLKAVTDGLKPQEEAQAKEQILALLKISENWMSAQDISKSINQNVEHIRRCLCRLFEEDRITRSTENIVGRGRPKHLYRIKN